MNTKQMYFHLFPFQIQVISNCHGSAGLARLRCAMARKCEEDIVPETKPNFGECKSNSSSSNSNSNGSSGNGGGAATTAKAVVGAGAASAAALLQKVSATDRILGAVSPKLDDDADDILSMSLNKIDSPPPPRSMSRTKGGGATVGSNSNSSSSSSSAGGVEDLVRRKSNALSKVQSKSDSPLDGASVGSSSGGGGGAASGSGAGKSSSAGGADMDGVDLCSTDEVKVFKDEGDRDDEKMSVEHNLLEEKSSLIDFTENEVSGLLMCEIATGRDSVMLIPGGRTMEAKNG